MKRPEEMTKEEMEKEIDFLLSTLIEKAEKGDKSAMRLLADLYGDENFAHYDKDEALKWEKRLSE